MEVKTYSYCEVQLNLFSLFKLSVFAGVFGGLAWALLLWFLSLSGLMHSIRFDNYLMNFITFPIMAVLISGSCSLLGYPLYAWYCRQNRGMKLRGIFHNPGD